MWTRIDALKLFPVMALLLSASCSRSSAPQWPPVVHGLEAPSGIGARDPRLTVNADRVVLSWIEQAETTSTLKFAARIDSGWTAPVTVASGSDWFVSYADPPNVLRLSDGTLVAQWLQQIDPRLEATNLQLSYSTDNGRTWSRPFTPHHDGTTTQHAFASLLELPGRGLGLVWLDGRESLIETDDPAGGSMTMRYASFDAQWRPVDDAAVDRRVCECCSTSAAMTAEGILTAYRDRSRTEVRDIAVSRFMNGAWSEATPVHADNWKIAGCPVNGPAISARGRQAVSAWFTAVDDQGRAYAAFSTDAGHSWGTPIRLDDQGSTGRVDVELLDDDSAVASWVELTPGGAELRMRRITAAGERLAAVTVAPVSGSSTGGFPQMARRGSELVFAWSQSEGEDGAGTYTVRTATALLERR